MELGVCYYPEHWPSAWWADDARQMRALGIGWVRIGEFAWSLVEPEPGRFDWAWLDRAIDTLHAAGLKVVLCTPTATPPKWLVDAMPEMLPIDAQGRPRHFGSRRHYGFSHPGYREQSRRITQALADRYGHHPAVQAWQTDNEYGCHDTVESHDAAARAGFRRWLAERYGDIASLNRAWGTVFWSMTYRSFDEIDPPASTVTEAHPSHRLDWRRFASAEVRAFNAEQVALLRRASPGRPITHNFMGFFTGLDPHEIAADLDIAAWDSYPLGFTQSDLFTAEEQVRWARSGHPDVPAFHHDLYRGLCASRRADAPAHGRWWVMEQQPGPVNWAAWNPAPHDGMVRLWSWQAFAHGAEVVSYFRWRQAPFAQEQMHTGLQRPDRSLDQGGREAGQVGAELARLAPQLRAAGTDVCNRVALVYDTDSLWMAQIQPQGASERPLARLFRVYSALRGLGLDVDIVAPQTPLSAYRLIVLPVQLHVAPALAGALQAAADGGAQIVLGPRSGSKSAMLTFPAAPGDADPDAAWALPPGPLTALAGVRVERVASLPPGLDAEVQTGEPHGGPDGSAWPVQGWREDLTLLGAQVEARFADRGADDGHPAITRHGTVRYIAGGLADDGWRAVLQRAAHDAGLDTQRLPDGLRLSRFGAWTLACNFADTPLAWRPAQVAPEAADSAAPDAGPLLGAAELEPRALALWHTPGREAAPAIGDPMAPTGDRR